MTFRSLDSKKIIEMAMQNMRAKANSNKYKATNVVSAFKNIQEILNDTLKIDNRTNTSVDVIIEDFNLIKSSNLSKDQIDSLIDSVDWTNLDHFLTNKSVFGIGHEMISVLSKVQAMSNKKNKDLRKGLAKSIRNISPSLYKKLKKDTPDLLMFLPDSSIDYNELLLNILFTGNNQHNIENFNPTITIKDLVNISYHDLFNKKNFAEFIGLYKEHVQNLDEKTRYVAYELLLAYNMHLDAIPIDYLNLRLLDIDPKQALVILNAKNETHLNLELPGL